MIDLKKDNECTVCGKCVLVCPMRAISYEIGKCGNYEPVINWDVCKECHICEKACAEQRHGSKNDFEKRHYIGYIDDETIRAQSSSGGIFSAAALWILSRKGVVIGAAYDERTLQVRHIAVSKEEDLQKLRKSKYVQSDWIESCETVKEAIHSEKWILFSGTPCQVQTAKEIFGNYPKIFFMDLFCHGVAMAGMFQKYMQMPDVKGVTSIDFRHRSADKEHNFMVCTKKDGRVYEQSWENNIFCRLYMNSAIMKRACFSCGYGEDHVSDITIGDFCDYRDYALEKHITYPFASIFSINTQKGGQLFSAMKEKLVWSEVDDEKIISHWYRKHADIHGDWGYNEDIWEEFHSLYQKKGFVEAAANIVYPDEIKLVQKIDKIRTEQDEIAIYGAGNVGKRLLSLIRLLGKQWKIKCYIVSVCGKEEWIEDIPIIPLRKADIDQRKNLVVIAVSSQYREGILRELDKVGITRYV